MAESRPRHARRSRRTSPPILERINPHAAGIDCGATTHVVAVPPDRDDEPVQSFRTFTADLHRLADWLVACGVISGSAEIWNRTGSRPLRIRPETARSISVGRFRPVAVSGSIVGGSPRID
jgi:hypothetical protein